jgi:hypothetical protein
MFDGPSQDAFDAFPYEVPIAVAGHDYIDGAHRDNLSFSPRKHLSMPAGCDLSLARQAL